MAELLFGRNLRVAALLLAPRGCPDETDRLLWVATLGQSPPNGLPGEARFRELHGRVVPEVDHPLFAVLANLYPPLLASCGQGIEK